MEGLIVVKIWWWFDDVVLLMDLNMSNMGYQ